MIKFKTDTLAKTLVQEVEVERETKCYVYIKNTHNKLRINKDAKRSEWTNYFDTFEEAIEFLLEQAAHKLVEAQNKVQAAEDRLTEIAQFNTLHKGD